MHVPAKTGELLPTNCIVPVAFGFYPMTQTQITGCVSWGRVCHGDVSADTLELRSGGGAAAVSRGRIC